MQDFGGSSCCFSWRCLALRALRLTGLRRMHCTMDYQRDHYYTHDELTELVNHWDGHTRCSTTSIGMASTMTSTFRLA